MNFSEGPFSDSRLDVSEAPPVSTDGMPREALPSRGGFDAFSIFHADGTSQGVDFPARPHLAQEDVIRADGTSQVLNFPDRSHHAQDLSLHRDLCLWLYVPKVLCIQIWLPGSTARPKVHDFSPRSSSPDPLLMRIC